MIINSSLAFASSDSKHDRELESLCFCLQATFSTTDSCVTACCDLTNFFLESTKNMSPAKHTAGNPECQFFNSQKAAFFE